MCDCATCGRLSRCDNPGCTNDECPDCQAGREADEQQAANMADDPDDVWYDALNRFFHDEQE